METEETSAGKKGISKSGLSFLLVAGFCFFIGWQIFNAAERTNLIVLQTCGNASKGLGSQALSIYADCVNAGYTGNSGGYIAIVIGVIFGIIGLVKLSTTSK